MPLSGLSGSSSSALPVTAAPATTALSMQPIPLSTNKDPPPATFHPTPFPTPMTQTTAKTYPAAIMSSGPKPTPDAFGATPFLPPPPSKMQQQQQQRQQQHQQQLATNPLGGALDGFGQPSFGAIINSSSQQQQQSSSVVAAAFQAEAAAVFPPSNAFGAPAATAGNNSGFQGLNITQQQSSNMGFGAGM